MVERYSAPYDQRISIIQITERGKAKIEEIFPQHLQQIHETLENLSNNEKEELIRLLRKVKQ